MAKRKLRVISKPGDKEKRTVLTTDNTDPKFVFFAGAGSDDLVCGYCARLLASKCPPSQVEGVVFLCPKCGHYNDTSDVPTAN
jgi:hypothetical protein